MNRFSFVALSLALISGVCRADESFAPLLIGQPVPDYSVRTLSGGSMRVGVGEPLTLVNIWATWCTPCRREFPAMQTLFDKYRGRRLRLLAVSVDRGADGPVRGFIERSQVTFDIGRDETGRIQRLFKSVGVPESFLIGADGRLLWHKVGMFDADGTDLHAAIESALKLKIKTKPQVN